jgi:hypothetical protein
MALIKYPGEEMVGFQVGFGMAGATSNMPHQRSRWAGLPQGCRSTDSCKKPNEPDQITPDCAKNPDSNFVRCA